jgi:hypothetical protein
MPGLLLPERDIIKMHAHVLLVTASATDIKRFFGKINF